MTQQIDEESHGQEVALWISQMRTMLEDQYRLYQLTLENNQKMRNHASVRPLPSETTLTLAVALKSLNSHLTQTDLRNVQRLRRTTKSLGWDSLSTVMSPQEAEKYASELIGKGRAKRFEGLLLKHPKIVKEMRL